MCHLILLAPLFGLFVFFLWPPVLAASIYAVICLLSIWLYYYIIKAMQQPVGTGVEALLNSTGRVLTGEHGQWRIRVNGEIWIANSATDLEPGKLVMVTGIQGLVLNVRPIEDESHQPVITHGKNNWV